MNVEDGPPGNEINGLGRIGRLPAPVGGIPVRTLHLGRPLPDGQTEVVVRGIVPLVAPRPPPQELTRGPRPNAGTKPDFVPALGRGGGRIGAHPGRPWRPVRLARGGPTWLPRATRPNRRHGRPGPDPLSGPRVPTLPPRRATLSLTLARRPLPALLSAPRPSAPRPGITPRIPTPRCPGTAPPPPGIPPPPGTTPPPPGTAPPPLGTAPPHPDTTPPPPSTTSPHPATTPPRPGPTPRSPAPRLPTSGALVVLVSLLHIVQQDGPISSRPIWGGRPP